MGLVGTKENSESTEEILAVPDCLRVLTAHEHSITATTAIDEETFATADSDGVIAIWSLITGELLNVLLRHELMVSTLLCVDDVLISGSSDKTLNFWSLPTGKEIQSFAKHEGSVKCLLQVSDDEFVSAGTDSLVIWWNIDGTIVQELKLRTVDNVQCLCLINSQRLLLGCDNGQILVWQLGEKEFPFRKLHRDSVQHIKKASGFVFISVSVDGLICVWKDDPKTVPILLYNLNQNDVNQPQYRNYTRKVRDIEILHGQYIAVAIENGFTIYDNEGNVFKECPDAHECWVLKLSTLNHGKILITGAVDGTIGIWKIIEDGLNTREEMLIEMFWAHSHSVTTLKSLHNSSFVSGDEEGTVILWQYLQNINNSQRDAIVHYLRHSNINRNFDQFHRSQGRL